MKDLTKINFNPTDYNNNISCEYDYGEMHPQIPVWQHCARCLFTKGMLTPLCSQCGFNYEGLKLCNSCYDEVNINREKEWTNN